MNELLLDLERKILHTVAYADDVVVLVRGKSPDTFTSLMQIILYVARTKLAMFTRKHRILDFPPPVLNRTIPTLGEKIS